MTDERDGRKQSIMQIFAQFQAEASKPDTSGISQLM
jgi:hypothetical protein